ncbi:WD repeat-containing protein 97-like [Heptranchias perlo]|uniref:WD repeat-containing protein 97-like n=1 Tax=Heptranchias perlo TaxID=212740 RepID=UPI00355A365A
MTFYGAHPATHLCVLKTMFVAALQTPACAVYSIVLYDLRLKIRRDHRPADDHKDEITDLSGCPELKIFASASVGGTLRIWDHNNQLLRVLHLKAVADSIAFCNDQGDLLLGIERNLYRMNSTEYLPQPYLLRLACRDHTDPVPDDPVPIPRTVLHSLSVDDRHRLRQPHSSKHRPEEHSQIGLDEQDEESRTHQEQVKEAYALLAAREAEILLIQRGELKCKKKAPRSKEVLQEGFRKYMQLFYVETPRIEIPEQEIFEPDEKPLRRAESPYACINVSRGFFPRLDLPKPWDDVNDMEKIARGLPSGAGPPTIPIALDGLIPNSVLLRLVWPLEHWELLEESEPESKVVSRVVSKELFKSKHSQSSETEITPSRGFLKKLEEAMASEHRKAEVVEEKQEKSSIDVLSSMETMERKLSKPEWTRAPLLPRVPVTGQPSPSKTLLPSVVARFQGTLWFEKLFPDADARTFPANLTEDGFAQMIIKLLAGADFQVKEGIAKALAALLMSGQPETIKLAHDTLINALRGPNPPGHKIREERDFIRAALWTLKELMPNSQELLVELMVQFVQCDIILRNTIKLLLADIGLRDPHNYFETELSSWSDCDEDNVTPTTKLRNLSRIWLKRWIRKFKDHINTAVKSLKKGKTLRGTVSIPTSPDGGPKDNTSIISNKMMIMKFAKPHQASSATRVRPIEGVNYYCDLELEQRLKAMTAAAEAEKDSRTFKNAVLLLPDIQRKRAILRLGETRSSVTAAQMDKLHLPPISSRPLHSGIGPFIKLPLARVNLLPFPSPIDLYPLQHVLITLRQSSQKYFILEHSYVANF